MKEIEMEKEYDFSKDERGKFYNQNVNFHIPIYLEPEVESFFTRLAEKQNINLSEIVNSLLFKNKELIEISGLK